LHQGPVRAHNAAQPGAVDGRGRSRTEDPGSRSARLPPARRAAPGPEGSAQARTYAAQALVQTRQIGDLIERLFDVSRIQAGRFELIIGPVDLLAVLRDAVEVAETLPNAPTIRLSPTRGSIVIQADAGRLQQVFVNLLANAIEHAATSPTIDVGRAKIRLGRHRRGSRSMAGDRRQRYAAAVQAVYATGA